MINRVLIIFYYYLATLQRWLRNPMTLMIVANAGGVPLRQTYSFSIEFYEPILKLKPIYFRWDVFLRRSWRALC